MKELLTENTLNILALVKALGFTPENKEHEIYTRDVWKKEVMNNTTNLGYVHYVASRLNYDNENKNNELQ